MICYGNPWKGKSRKGKEKKSVSPSIICCTKKSILGETHENCRDCDTKGWLQVWWGRSNLEVISFSLIYNNCRFEGCDSGLKYTCGNVRLCSSVICITDQLCLCTVEWEVCQGCMFTLGRNSLSEQKCVRVQSQSSNGWNQIEDNLWLFKKRTNRKKIENFAVINSSSCHGSSVMSVTRQSLSTVHCSEVLLRGIHRCCCYY